ncbi:PAAR domain-containing protein [Photorhabdus heterorhabditis]|uniref:PAAR domain-containing protein n=1 Tax=Photorhabdus heterorhabditis TaxID=880156 RepID=UPI003D161F6E
MECPQCKGIFPIIQGADSLKYKGKPIALEGMQTACGAKLIASQSKFTHDF